MHAALEDDKCRAIASSLKRFGEIVGIPLVQIPCDVEVVRHLMVKATPGAYGVCQDYWGTK